MPSPPGPGAPDTADAQQQTGLEEGLTETNQFPPQPAPPRPRSHFNRPFATLLRPIPPNFTGPFPVIPLNPPPILPNHQQPFLPIIPAPVEPPQPRSDLEQTEEKADSLDSITDIQEGGSENLPVQHQPKLLPQKPVIIMLTEEEAEAEHRKLLEVEHRRFYATEAAREQERQDTDRPPEETTETPISETPITEATTEKTLPPGYIPLPKEFGDISHIDFSEFDESDSLKTADQEANQGEEEGHLANLISIANEPAIPEFVMLKRGNDRDDHSINRTISPKMRYRMLEEQRRRLEFEKQQNATNGRKEKEPQRENTEHTPEQSAESEERTPPNQEAPTRPDENDRPPVNNKSDFYTPAPSWMENAPTTRKRSKDVFQNMSHFLRRMLYNISNVSHPSTALHKTAAIKI